MYRMADTNSLRLRANGDWPTTGKCVILEPKGAISFEKNIQGENSVRCFFSIAAPNVNRWDQTFVISPLLFSPSLASNRNCHLRDSQQGEFHIQIRRWSVGCRLGKKLGTILGALVNGVR
jgi:hypothetical protein